MKTLVILFKIMPNQGNVLFSTIFKLCWIQDRAHWNRANWGPPVVALNGTIASLCLNLNLTGEPSCIKISLHAETIIINGNNTETILAKGHLISKANYGLTTSSKKWTDEFDLFAFLLFTANKSNQIRSFFGRS
jgi:hypothetical protein